MQRTPISACGPCCPGACPLGLIAFLIGNQFDTVRSTSASDEDKGISSEGALAVFIGYGMIKRVDWIIGTFIPAFCVIVTSGIFFAICMS